MSLYNIINGFNTGACLFLAPMLTEENPQTFFPRFRDCWAEDGNIVVFTRVGGNNRSCKNSPHYDPAWDYGESKLYDMPTFLVTYDDDFDDTYGYYVFGVPTEFKADFDAVMDGRFGDISENLISRIEKCYPSIDVRSKIAEALDLQAATKRAEEIEQSVMKFKVVE